MADALLPQAGSATGGYTVLARRYRSTGFDELVGQEPIARALQNAIAHNRTAHAYLFTGTRGVGKTSMARVFAKALNCTDDLQERDAIARAILRGEDIDVVEIDGASNRGIDNARDLIAGAGILPARCPYKIYIIDEVHMLTREAFNALLKLMEEPPPHVKFILCTTEPHKVPPTIQSRCQRFDFRNISLQRIAEHLRSVLEHEGIEAEEEAVFQVARLANGSMRDGLSLLDRLIAASDGRLTTALLEEVLGLPDRTLVESLVDAIADGDAAGALRQAAELLERGHSIEQAIDAIAEQFRAVMLCAVVGPDAALVDRAGEGLDVARRQAERFDAPALVHMIALGEAVARHARQSSTPRALFDALVVRLSLAERFLSIPAAIAGGGDEPSESEKKNESRRRTERPALTSAPATTSAPRAAAQREPLPEPKPARRPQSSGRRDSGAASGVDADAGTTGAASRDGALRDGQPDPGREPSAFPRSGSAAGHTLEAVWSAVLEAAAGRARDEALVEELRPVALEDGGLRVAVASENPALASFVRESASALAALVERAVGRRMRVSVDSGPAPSEAAPARALEGVEALARDPLVRRAMDLFEAAIVEIAPRGGGPASARAQAETDDGGNIDDEPGDHDHA